MCQYIAAPYGSILFTMSSFPDESEDLGSLIFGSDPLELISFLPLLHTTLVSTAGGMLIK